MLTSNIIQGQYGFQNNPPFDPNEIYYSTLNEQQYFKIGSMPYTSMYTDIQGGNTTLHYVDVDEHDTIVWIDGTGWTDNKYKSIFFENLFEMESTYYTKLQPLLTKQSNLIQGYYQFDSPYFDSASYLEATLFGEYYFISNGRKFTSIKYDDYNDVMFYDDLEVYTQQDHHWIDEEYATIYFPNGTYIPSNFYNFILDQCTKQTILTIVNPMFEGFQSFCAEYIGERYYISNFIYQLYQVYNLYNKEYYIEGYYNDVNFTSRITSSYITPLVDTTIYVKTLPVVYVEDEKYKLPSSITSWGEFMYLDNLKIKRRGYNTLYKGVSRIGNKLTLIAQDDSTYDMYVNNQPVVEENRFFEIIDSKIPFELDTTIIGTGGNYCFDAAYVSNYNITISPLEWVSNIGTLPTFSVTSPQELIGWYYDPLFIKEAQDNDVIDSNVTLYAKIGVPSSINIYLYQNKNSNNSINKTPTQVAVIEGTFKRPTSVVHPVVEIQYNSVAFNYCYIQEFNRYYYVDDIVVINNKLIEIHCTSDVLMSFKNQLMTHTAIVKRNEYEYDAYLDDEREKIEKGKQYKIIEAVGGVDISSANSRSNNGNIVLIGVR